MNDLEERLKTLKIEDFIWIIYIGIIILSLYSNVLERDYLINKNNRSKNKYRNINILVFTTLVIVYAYFTKSTYDDCKKHKENKYNNISLIATTLALISGILFLYIATNDSEIETEIAFS